MLRVALDAVEHFEAAPAAGAFDGVGGIGDLLKFPEHKARDDDEAFEEVRLDQVGDAPVNDDAGVEQQQVVRLVLRREPDVGDDEREILLVAAHGEDDADVAEAQKQAEPDEPAVRWSSALSKRPERSMSSATSVPSSRPKVMAENARSEKPLSISSTAINKPAEAEADHHAEQACVGKSDKFRADLTDGVAGQDAQSQKQNPDDPKWFHFGREENIEHSTFNVQRSMKCSRVNRLEVGRCMLKVERFIFIRLRRGAKAAREAPHWWRAPPFLVPEKTPQAEPV